MKPDHYAETFSKAMFNYLWFNENFISIDEFRGTVADIEDDLLDFAGEAAKSVLALSLLSGSDFKNSMEISFKQVEITRLHVFTFLTVYTYRHHVVTEDIFAVVLNTCTFIYTLFMFCVNEGKQEFRLFASMCWMELFERFLRKEFQERGGWYLFRKYVMENQFVEIERVNYDPRTIIKFLDDVTSILSKTSIDNPVQLKNHRSPETVNDERSCVEGTVEKQSNGEAAGFSFGTVDLIAADIPGFNEDSDAVVFEFDNPKAKPVKLKKQSKLQSYVKSVLPSINLKIDDMFLQENQACPPMKYTEVDRDSVESGSETEVCTSTLATSVVKLKKQSKLQSCVKSVLPSINPEIDDMFLQESQACPPMKYTEVDCDSVESGSGTEVYTSTLATSATIVEDPKEDAIQVKSCKGLLDSSIKVTEPQKSDISRKILEERNRIKDEQIILGSLQDFLYPKGTETPNTDFEQFSEKIYVNGECFEKYVFIVKCAARDCDGKNEPVGVSDISETSPEKNTIKDDQTICREPLSDQTIESSGADNSDKWCVNGQFFDKFKNVTTDCNSNYDSGGISEGCPEKNPSNCDQTICKDLLVCEATESPNADNEETFSDTLIVNGVRFQKYIFVPANGVKTDGNEDHGSDTESNEECIV